VNGTCVKWWWGGVVAAMAVGRCGVWSNHSGSGMQEQRFVDICIACAAWYESAVREQCV